MYRSKLIHSPMTNETVEHIFCSLGDGVMQSFPNLESNESPERKAYLEWLAAGNTPEPWNPEQENN